jgi:hypothetical protein
MTTVAMNTQLWLLSFVDLHILLSTVWTIECCLRNQQLFHMLCCRDNISCQQYNIFSSSRKVPDIYVGVWTKYEYFDRFLQKYPILNVIPIHLVGARDDKADRQTGMILKAESGLGRRRNFCTPPPIRTDRLTIFTANRKDWPSLSEWPRLCLLPLISKSTNNDSTKKKYKNICKIIGPRTPFRTVRPRYFLPASFSSLWHWT